MSESEKLYPQPKTPPNQKRPKKTPSRSSPKSLRRPPATFAALRRPPATFAPLRRPPATIVTLQHRLTSLLRCPLIKKRSRNRSIKNRTHLSCSTPSPSGDLRHTPSPSDLRRPLVAVHHRCPNRRRPDGFPFVLGSILPQVRDSEFDFSPDDDKQPEIQIGAPTDVKHVAHIGCDGPAVESPSWMRDFEAPTESQSGPLDMTGAPRETPEVKLVSEDSSQRKGRKDHGSHRSTRSEDGSHRSTRSEEGSRDLPVLPRSNRNRHHSMEMDPDSSDSSTKPRRRHHKGRRSQDQTLAEDSNSKPDVPKRSSRPKKSKEESSGGGSSKPNNSELGTEESA